MLMDEKCNEQHNLKPASMTTPPPLYTCHEQISFISLKFCYFFTRDVSATVKVKREDGRSNYNTSLIQKPAPRTPIGQ
jgi:hypothetical protein